MSTTSTSIAPRQASLTAGVGYVALFFAAIFANFLVLESYVVPGDAAQTVANLTENEATFRMGIVAFIGIFAIDVVVAWALFYVFAPIARGASLLAAWLRLAYTVMLGVAVVFLMAVAGILASDTHALAFTPEQVESQVMLLLDGFQYAWMTGLAVFGIHLGVLGFIMVTTVVGPRPLGVALIVAGWAYVVDTFLFTVMRNYEAYADSFTMMVAIPAVIAELWLTIWLFAKGGKSTDAVADDERMLAHV